LTEIKVKLKINGEYREISVYPSESLNFTLRNRLGLTGTKKGCDTGGCGACTVLVNGRSRYSCMTYTATLELSNIETIEGLSKEGKLDDIQQAYVAHGALQCGFCTPGFIMSTKGLLDTIANPSDDQIKEALIGNICRCTGYYKILDAVKSLTHRKNSGDASSAI
jgi:aerobic-type carbon monoxide dehydrogenase small subunit (CoxS/CutS family)